MCAGVADVDSSAADDDQDFVPLGDNKRVSLSEFGGKTRVDLREFYQVC